MNNEEIISVFIKDLNRLSDEVTSYSSEQDLWKIDGHIINCAGNLVLHITGNLQHFIGHVLGGSNYQRDRPAEFSQKGVPRKELLALIDRSKEAVTHTLERFTDKDYIASYPLEGAFGMDRISTIQALFHLASHLGYHLGQVNYHRRLLT